MAAATSKLKWLCTESLPIPLQASLLLLSLVMILSSISFTLLPDNSWGFTSQGALLPLHFGGAAAAGKESAPGMPPLPAPHEIAIFVTEDYPKNKPAQAPATVIRNLTDYRANQPPATEYSATTGFNRGIPSPAPAPDVAAVDEGERFLVPLLSFEVGAGNQLMEYMSAAVVARALNRTLCLTPFFSGPSKHNGLSVRVRGGLSWDDRYSVLSLARFTRVMSIEHCLRRCNATLNSNWLLKMTRQPLVRNWAKYPLNNESWNLDWSYTKWQSAANISAALGSFNDRCVGLGGLFPGLRWRGAFLAVSAFLQPAPHVAAVTNVLQEHALGKDTPYLAVHWRFEESECGTHQIGLCFVRCSNGAVVDSGLRPQAKEWHVAAQAQCPGGAHLRGVGVDKRDILHVIEERAAHHSLTTLYLATDGWIRGPDGVALVTEIVLTLRSHGLTVIGLWKIPGLPNFADGKYFDPYFTLGKANQINGQQIALVEQELCARAAVFVGSGQSTWSLAVFRVRLARRRAKKIMEDSPGGGGGGGDPAAAARDELVIRTLLTDDHAAGLHCRYARYMKPAAGNETVETYADEYPDGWLDLEACEGRVGRGGHCQVAKCF